MTALQPIHFLDNLDMTFGKSNMNLHNRSVQVFRRMFRISNDVGGRHRMTEFFTGVSDKRLVRFAEQNLIPLAPDGRTPLVRETPWGWGVIDVNELPDSAFITPEGRDLSEYKGKNRYGRTRTRYLNFGDSATSRRIDMRDVRTNNEPALMRQFQRVYNGPVAAWFDSVDMYWTQKLVLGIQRLGLPRDPNRNMSQNEIDDIIARTATQHNRNAGGTVRTVLDADGNSTGRFESVDANGNVVILDADGMPIDPVRVTPSDNINNISDPDIRAGAQQVVGDDLPINQRVAGNMTPTTKATIRTKIARGSGITALIGTVIGLECVAFTIFSAAVAIQNMQNIAQQESGALLVLSELERVKFGDADQHAVSGIMEKMNARSSYQIQTGGNVSGTTWGDGVRSQTITRTGPESDAWKYAIDGQAITSPSPITIASLNNVSLNMWIRGMAQTNPGMAAFFEIATSRGQTMCKIASNPVFQIGLFVVGTVAAIFALPKITIGAVLATIGISAGIGIVIAAISPFAINMAIEHVVGPLVSTFIADVFGVDAYGQHFTSSVVAGAGARYGSHGQSRGALTATTESALAVHDNYRNYLAERSAEEREGRSPFDVTSIHTFAGTFFSSIMPQRPALSSPATIMGGIGSLFSNSFLALSPSVSAADERAVAEARLGNNWCEHSDHSANDNLTGVDDNLRFAVDIFCNPYRVTSRDYIDPQEVIETLFEWRMIEPILDEASGGSRMRVHKTRYNCNGRWYFGGAFDPENAQEGGALHGLIASEGCDREITGLYLFQKTYLERIQPIGEKELPSVTCFNFDVATSRCVDWDSDERIKGVNAAAWVFNAVVAGLFEDGFEFRSVRDDRWIEMGGVSFNGRTVNRGDWMTGRIGIDDGSLERNLYSLFFMDMNTLYNINGDQLFGSTVH